MFRRWRFSQQARAPVEHHQPQTRVAFQIDTQALAAAGVQVAAATDPGCVREQNEDYLGLYMLPPAVPQDVGLLAVLADGMGGHAAGEVASELAVATIAATFSQAELADDTGIPDDGVSEASRRLYAGFLAADHAIRRAGQRSPHQEGMGCTCIAAVQRGEEITLAHVGDTRAYLIQADRADPIRQLTADHSFAAELVRAGVLAEEEARHSPRRHMVTRALGGQLEMTACLPDVQAFRLCAGDILLLCCDGLWNMVAPEQIAAAVQDVPLDHACTTLIEQAREAGGEDNISLILLAVRSRK
jgi:serine/threonine protein phosphatase PrpC